MTPQETYRSATAASWSRIDMLLALYHETEIAMQAAQDAHTEGNGTEYAKQHVRTIRLLLAILEGINPEHDEISRNVRDLCVFIIREFSNMSQPSLTSALNVLRTLKQSFEEIREEANRLEQAGHIPKLSTTALELNIAIG